ncbi:hypothetical protein NM688_g2470 [Phlebia brevispora]|uniref:Uncharacterized protein n=1 Tax=Phlebia brevispora TaxID=194682 RepID=A0ACC1T8W4_9APHY|nr:hypothetical protein NM688_g2470 [Phlebia brevispora]
MAECRASSTPPSSSNSTPTSPGNDESRCDSWSPAPHIQTPSLQSSFMFHNFNHVDALPSTVFFPSLEQNVPSVNDGIFLTVPSQATNVNPTIPMSFSHTQPMSGSSCQCYPQEFVSFLRYLQVMLQTERARIGQARASLNSSDMALTLVQESLDMLFQSMRHG